MIDGWSEPRLTKQCVIPALICHISVRVADWSEKGAQVADLPDCLEKGKGSCVNPGGGKQYCNEAQNKGSYIALLAKASCGEDEILKLWKYNA